MKAFGIAMVSLLAAAGGVAAATYLAKKKLDRENEDDYFDGWDDGFDDDWDLDFDEDEDFSEDDETPAGVKASIPEENAGVFEETADESTEEEL